MAGAVEARLKALDLVLPEVASPLANYVPFLHLDGQLFVSGQLPMQGGRVAVAGKLGADLGLEQGEAAARLCLLNVLAQAKRGFTRSRPHRAMPPPQWLRQCEPRFH